MIPGKAWSIGFALVAGWLCLGGPAAAVEPQDGTVDVSVQAPLTPEGERTLRGIPPDGIRLQEAVEIVLQRSPMSRVAEADVEAAGHGRKAARGDYFPKLKTTLDYTRLSEVREIDFTIPGMAPIRVPSGTQEVLSSQTTLEQPLFTGFALQGQYRMTELEQEAAWVRRDQIRQELILQTYQAYYGILVAEKGVEVMEQAVTQLESHAEVARQFYENGMIPKNDMLKSLVTLAEAQQRKSAPSHDLELAWVQFNTLLRLEAGPGAVRLAEPLDRKPYGRPVEACVEIGLANNPAIRQAALDVRKAETAVTLARSGFFPSFALVGGLNHEEGGFSEVGAELSATLHGQWMVWEWGRTYYDVQKSRAQVEMARAEQTRQMDTVRYQVREAYLKMKESDESVDVAWSSIEQAEENYRITVEQYNENITTSTEVPDAQTLQAEAQMNYYRALTSYNIAIAALAKAMGTLGPSRTPGAGTGDEPAAPQDV